MSDRVYRLLERHQKLDDVLRRVLRHKAPDTLEVLRLKKLKLAVKDRLAALARMPGAQR